MKRIFVNFVAYHGGGTADAYQMIKALVENNCEVYVVLSKNMENIALWRKIKGLHIYEVNGYTSKLNFYPRLLKFLLFDLNKIYKKVRSLGITDMYIPMISYWTYYIFRKFKKFRVFYTMHDVRPHDEKTNTIIWKQSELIAHKCSDIIILSEFFRKTVIENYKKTNDRIHVLSLGCQQYYPVKEYKKNSDRFEFVFYGRIDDYKGLDVLAKAYKIILNDYKDIIHLTIAGSGDFSKYEKDFDDIDSNNLTIINRWIKDEEVYDFFNYEKSITIIPYKNATQSGVIPIAMTFNSLVISTNCAGLSEQVIDNYTGFLIEPNNAYELAEKMIYVINNWDKAKLLSYNAKKYINDNSWNNIANKLLEKI